MRIVFIVALFLLFGTSAVSASSTPEASPTPRISCTELSDYQQDVYYHYDPFLSMTEYGVISAAWEGSDAWEQMRLPELVMAAEYYDAWASDLRSFTAEELPSGIATYHEQRTRGIQILADAIRAYINGDSLSELNQENANLYEAMYLVELEGVAQCRDEWVDVFGEPWDPSPDPTPAATPTF